MGCYSSKSKSEDGKKFQASKVSANNPNTNMNKDLTQILEKNKDIDIQEKYSILKPPFLQTDVIFEKAINKISGMLRAVKRISKNTSTTNLQSVHNEISILSQVDHPNIIKIYEIFQDKYNMYIVQDFCQGKDMYDRIQQQTEGFSEALVSNYIYQILSCLNYLHGKKIIHRDVRPEHILFNDDRATSSIKLSGFKNAAYTDNCPKLDFQGVYKYYMAPEIISEVYTDKCDIWSTGVVLHLLLSGYLPFFAQGEQEIIERIKRGLYTINKQSPEWANVSDDAIDLIKNMLVVNQKKRFSASQCLSHRWFQKFNQKEAIDSVELKTSYQNLKAFTAKETVKKSIYKFIIQNLLTEEEQSTLKKIFQNIDKNNNGIITKQEIISCYNQFMNAAEAEEEVKSILDNLELSNPDQINYSEFLVAATHKQQILNQRRLEQAFQMIDKDGNGQLSASEIQAMLGTINQPELAAKLTLAADKNNDNQISLKEFKEFMLTSVIKN